jgi:hypothetical protein
MMRVDVEVSIALQPQVHHRMLREKRQHVIEKRDSGPHGGLPTPINAQGQGDPGLFRLSADLGPPFCHFLLI